MNNTTLHHTIRNRTSAKLFLCCQWAERIEFESRELASDIQKADDETAQKRAIDDFHVWFTRLHEDTDIARRRVRQDGYEYAGIWQLMDTLNEDDCQLIPIIPKENPGLAFWINAVELWRKAVQS